MALLSHTGASFQYAGPASFHSSRVLASSATKELELRTDSYLGGHSNDDHVIATVAQRVPLYSTTPSDTSLCERSLLDKTVWLDCNICQEDLQLVAEGRKIPCQAHSLCQHTCNAFLCMSASERSGDSRKLHTTIACRPDPDVWLPDAVSLDTLAESHTPTRPGAAWNS